ncbi:MAG: tyrosine-type recombinase/integrase [Synergistaceae bacterium]|nr:tyrosine-type recombinase/integrase [Synergistaceae bacterium]
MLSEAQVRNMKAKEKPFMVRDDRGLNLRVDPSGRKYWIFRYWENKKEHQISLGPYPDLSLKDARLKRDELQMTRAKGESISKIPRFFSEAASQWLKIRMKGKAENYLKTVCLRLNKYILPEFGSTPLNEIKAPDVLRLCRKIEDTGHDETARRVKIVVGQIFRFAIASGWAENDPTSALLGALSPRKSKHYATLTDPSEISILMRAMKAYPYTLIRCAMLFSAYTAARPGEVRAAEWSEIKGDLWDIPAGKMKMKRRHIVPLSKQVKEIIEQLRPLTGKGRYIFPSPRNDGRCMSDNGVRMALRGMGFTKEQITPHGFRAMFSTIANEHGWNRDVIERQLAHVEENSVRGAYNHAEYMPERIKIMQWWADWLDGLAEK